jgi:NAD(P)-dependent dehydrogenase (short-subunit alcohol dehydrogenase family)
VSNRFDDVRVAILGAGAGLGAQIASDFEGEGARVARFDLRLPKEVHQDRLWWAGDVSSAEDVDGFMAGTLRELGGVDVLVNCAGVASRAAVHEIAEDAWDRVMNVNLKGTFLSVRAVLPVMIDQPGGGVIINLASQAGVRVEPGMSSYCASKAAVIQFTKSVALEYSPRIRANAVCPGLIETELVQNAFADYAKQSGKSYDEVRDERRSVIPLRRFQTPKNLSDSVLFLASDSASEITGAVFDVSGGEMIPR